VQQTEDNWHNTVQPKFCRFQWFQ